MSQQYNCPSCGAPLEIQHRFSRMVICRYCNQTSQITPQGLDPTGEAPQLVASPSIFAVGASGRLSGQPFRVLGRLRYRYDGGFWDEWFLKTGDDRSIWLQEDDGELTAFEKERVRTAVPPFDEIRVGSIINVNDLSLFVLERTPASIIGGEGELHFRVTPGQEVNCVDGNAGGHIYSLEYLPDEINLSRGRDVARSEIDLD